MKIQINTDANIQGHEALATQLTATVQHALQHVESHVTRIEVHLSDQNAGKSGQQDKRCVMEARLEGYAPIAATDEAATPEQAVRGAADKLSRLIDTQLGRNSRS